MARNGTHHGAIRSFLLAKIASGDVDPAGAAAAAFGFTRQAANAYLRALTANGEVVATGRTRGRRYELGQRRWMQVFWLKDRPQEDLIWRDFVRPKLGEIPDNVLRVCEYGTTEMLNNAIEHSEGSFASCAVILTPIALVLAVTDDGVGIFRKIRESFGLQDDRHSILELAKGKLTTDRSRHTGEGIFFSSRMFDRFSMTAGSLGFVHLPDHSDWLIEQDDPQPHGNVPSGTMVTMTISRDSDRSIKDVFDKHTSDDGDYRFDVTHVPVGLARLGDENLVSRSQAKRLLARVERFARVVLDFANVHTIGQAFADELFRVFPQEHEAVRLEWINAAPDVEKMIRRAIARREEEHEADSR